jgi:hypothetical protein
MQAKTSFFLNNSERLYVPPFRVAGHASGFISSSGDSRDKPGRSPALVAFWLTPDV